MHQIHSVDQIKEVLGRCRSYVTLCIIRDMDQVSLVRPDKIELTSLDWYRYRSWTTYPTWPGITINQLGHFCHQCPARISWRYFWLSVWRSDTVDKWACSSLLWRYSSRKVGIDYEFITYFLIYLKRWIYYWVKTVEVCEITSAINLHRINLTLRRKALREMEVKKAKKKSVGLFRSVSSLSTSSRRQETEPDRPVLERIRLSVGRRSVDDYSNHPINEIWNENENRQSPTNILEPVFDETPTVAPTAPPIETSDEEPTPTSHSNNEEEKELIEALKASSISSKSPSRASSIKVPVR